MCLFIKETIEGYTGPGGSRDWFLSSASFGFHNGTGVGFDAETQFRLAVGGNERINVDSTGHLKIFNGAIYSDNTASVGLTPSAGDWINIGRIPYGAAVSGEILIQWFSLQAPSCCHHGHMRFALGSSHGPTYNYQWASSLELVEAQAHNDFWFREARLIMVTTGGSNYLYLQVKDLLKTE